MNRINWIFLIAIGISLCFSSCFLDKECISGDGPTVNQELILDDFTGIMLSNSADVTIKQGAAQKVSVEGQQNVIDDLELDVRDGIWDINSKSCIRNRSDLRITIIIPEITALHIAGSGEIVSVNTLEVNDLDLSISGSGDMDLSLTANEIDARVSGSGNVHLNGEADIMHYQVSGSGDLRAFGLVSRIVSINISGSGNAEVNVTEELDVKISGSGDVYYRGNPTVNVDISGSGGIKDAN